jgi:hypothetical protein
MDVAGSRAGSWYNGPLSKSQENPGLQHAENGERPPNPVRVLIEAGALRLA